MSSTASTTASAELSPTQRLDVLFDELAELAGQRNAIDGRMVEIVAEVDRDRLWGATGARSLSGLVAWKLGASTKNATTIAAVAQRFEEFPRCTQSLREGRVSLDQVGVIAQHGGAGSDDHYAQLIEYAT
ncbi:MAG: 13E12 repeat family protein, partial [Actinomycetota bacterium]|nr:13E12 repeat family protein [Actinomycetota bacterium]